MSAADEEFSKFERRERECGAAGAPCPICNTSEPPQMLEGFKIDTDKSGSRGIDWQGR